MLNNKFYLKSLLVFGGGLVWVSVSSCWEELAVVKFVGLGNF